ncbi:fungal-specific transcription factor domain-containing protein [Microdochium trichocladiopsis]|uniref:Fungal-specific transcription factor domain-containing protein n=1 Tax=Microdochium trichocladiopsis TaxID=1682393 RepID=A0A9P8XWI8_9PEZI|nr:fungal-specific transcription factor domain-containing protein [Microdochium trichocladiopsis]KAH7016430.1 fungal-specific transcription factor domain-containing protein [Microdochium trichocladiopsis]
MRLSWPSARDKKRANVGRPPPSALSSAQAADHTLFINTTWQDMELYEHLSRRTQASPRPPPTADPWRQPQLGTNHRDLVNHFHDSAYLSLVVFDGKPAQMRDSLIRMALANDSILGLALFQALLAYSSVHRSGVDQRALQLKISALHTLSAFNKATPLSSAEAAQHVATSMLLGAFDILQPAAGSGEWLWYTQGAMDVVQATSIRDQSHDSDIGHLLDWVHYHDALSRFPVQHWQHKSLARDVPNSKFGNPLGEPHMSLTRHRPAIPSPNPTFAIINLLSEACDTLLDPRDLRSHTQEYQNHLRTLESRLAAIQPRSESAYSDEAVLPIEIFRTATQIYITRASESPWDTPASLDSLVETAFTGPIRDCYCPHFFPLFILACEARADERRTQILSLIERTAADGRVRNRAWLKNMVHSIWVHQDLHADSDLLVNYAGIMSAVISSSDTVPSFV